MSRSRKIAAMCAGALGIALMLSACSTSRDAAPQAAAVAPAPPVSGTVATNVVSATATVKKIDLKSRMVTLERADGSVIKFRAGDEVRNLAQVEVGDEVTATYYESLAYDVRTPGDGAAPGVAVSEGLERATLGEKPGATGGRVVTVTATIAAIDKQAMTVTLRSPDGESTTIKARDPQKLDRVAVGDLVDITYTEALAISVEPPAKK